MSEKRFTSAIDSNGLKSIFDNEREDCNEPILFNCIGDVDTVVDLLNELAEENNILNKNEDDLKECTIENIKLKEENDELKQEIIVYKKAFQEQVQRCTL